MADEDSEGSSLENMVEPGSSGGQKIRKPKKPVPKWVGKAAGTGAAIILSGAMLLGSGLYVKGRFDAALRDNPAVSFIESMREVGQGVQQDIGELVDYISNLGFVAGTQQFINQNIVVPYNTIVPVYGEPLVIPTNEVYVATDTYLIIRVDQATNKLFGNLFAVVPETSLQYNGKDAASIYDVNIDVAPTTVTETKLKPGEVMTIQGIAINVQPRLNTGQISVQRLSAAHISYNLEISYSQPTQVFIQPFSGTTLPELEEYLTVLGQNRIDYKLTASLSSISLENTLNMVLGVPPVTVNTVPLTDSRYQNPALETIDNVTQQAWPVPGINTLGDFLRYITNMKAITEAFQQMYLNVPGWTTEARTMPGFEQIPQAVLPIISEPTTNLRKVPMPEYFPELWKDTTEEGISKIYLELIKLTVHAGVNPPMSCSADINRVNSIVTGDSSNTTYLQDNSISVVPECKISEDNTLNVHVPQPYVASLQQKVEDYLAEMRASADPAVTQGIDYSNLEIKILPSP